jgi:deoxyribonuclease (pyrimidine dimer)
MMTRINLVPPEELCDQHLAAELHELPRIPWLVARGKVNWKINPPKQFKFGEGHVRFFYTRQAFLYRRHGLLCAEARWRGWTIKSGTLPLWADVCKTPVVQINWQPTEQDVAVSADRLWLSWPAQAKKYGQAYRCPYTDLRLRLTANLWDHVP